MKIQKKIEKMFAHALVGKILEVTISEGFEGGKISIRRFKVKDVCVSGWGFVRISGDGRLDTDGELLSIRQTMDLIDFEHFAYCEPVDGVERVHHYDIKDVMSEI